MRLFVSIALFFTSIAAADEFRHVGDFLLKAHYKLSGENKVPIPMKPIAFHVFTDGITVRVSPEGEKEVYTSYEIYRSDGIGRQRSGSGALEIIPGVQAYSTSGGILRHLRLSKENLTLTTFPGVSNQTIVSHAVAAISKDADTAKK